MTLVLQLMLNEEGSNATEYALLAALIAMAIVSGAYNLGTSLGNVFNGMAAEVDDVPHP